MYTSGHTYILSGMRMRLLPVNQKSTSGDATSLLQDSYVIYYIGLYQCHAVTYVNKSVALVLLGKEGSRLVLLMAAWIGNRCKCSLVRRFSPLAYIHVRTIVPVYDL